MNERRHSRTVFVLTLIFVSVPFFLMATPTSKRVWTLSSALVEQLKNLPYGLTHQRSLFLRFKHVEFVQFFGAGSHSRFTFRRGQSLVPEGLSLFLTNTGKENWASGAVHFKKPIDVTKYNSLVVWAQTSTPEMRIWMGLRSAEASRKKEGSPPARTDVLPIQGFPPGEPVQLVIPLSRFFSHPKINLAAVNQITFEFGQETVGNPKPGNIEILGFAFVEQTQPLKRAQVVLNHPQPKVVMGEAPKSIASDDQEPAPKPVHAVKRKPDAPRPHRLSYLGRTVKALLQMNDDEAANFFKQMGLDFTRQNEPSDGSENRPTKQPKPFSRDWIQPYARSWPLVPVAEASDVVNDVALPVPQQTRPSHVSESWTYGVLLALMIAWLAARRRRRQMEVAPRLGKVFHEIHWPFLVAEPSSNRRVERDFWKGVAAQHVHFGWLSTTGMVIEKNSPGGYFGESFLRRQIMSATKAGVRVFPSLSFTDSVFRKGTLLSNPQRSASALRTLATETLLRLTDIASGVRIEDAAALLNAKLRRRLPKIAHKNGDSATHEREFWFDVIGTVKEKSPDFLFIADGVGPHAQLVREVGFDYFENDALTKTLVRQIQMGEVGSLPTLLSGDAVPLLKYSIFNTTPLLKPLPKKETEQHQNFLGAVLVALIPGVLQHDDSLPDDLGGFVSHMTRSSVLRKGQFSLLATTSPAVFAFARWQHKSVFMAVANFSTLPQDVIVRLEPFHEGFDNNKLYLFNNALHGASSLQKLLRQSDASGPALALWGQNLRDLGLPLTIPGLSPSLFSVSLSRPITNAAIVTPIEEGAVSALTK